MRLLSKRLILASLVATGIGWAAAVRAEDKTGDKATAEVRAAAKEYLAAMRRGDRKAVCNMWTPDGEYVDTAGQKYKVREMLSQRDVELPREPEGSKPATPESALRFPKPDVAMEEGVSDIGGAVCRFTATWVKRDGHWRLDNLREAAGASPAAKGPLKGLEWLIGEWAGKAEGGAVLVSSHWSDNGHYMIREFAELKDGGEPISGTQRIKWDEASGKIKCWTFDSQGNAAEGVWRQDGKRWIVEMTAATPDGKKTMTTTYSPGEAGRFVWETAGTKVGGENVSPRRIEFKRAADK